MTISDLVRATTRDVRTAIGTIKLPLIKPFTIDTITIPKIEMRKTLSIFLIKILENHMYMQGLLLKQA